MSILLLQLLLVLCLQQDKATTFKIHPESPGNCETNIRILAELTNTVSQLGSNEVIIVIARPGRSETVTLSEQRLCTLKDFLNIPKNKLITAIGEPTNGYGQVEFYVKGSPLIAIPIGKNQQFEVGDCIGNFRVPKDCLPKKKKQK